MYELPLIETDGLPEPDELFNMPQTQLYSSGNTQIKYISPVYKHALTHQRLHVRFIQLDEPPVSLPPHYFFTEVKKLKNLALPQIIFIFLTKFLN